MNVRSRSQDGKNVQSSSIVLQEACVCVSVELKKARMTALAIEHMCARFRGDDGFVVFLERLDACIGNPDLPVRVVEQGFNRPHDKGEVCVCACRGSEEGMCAGWKDDESKRRNELQERMVHPFVQVTGESTLEGFFQSHSSFLHSLL